MSSASASRFLFSLMPWSLVSTGLANGSPHVVTLHILCDLHGPDSAGFHLQWHHGADHLAGLVHVLLGSVSLSWLGCLDWEEDKLGLVLLEALDVQLKGLNAAVTATHVNADANGLGLLL